MKNPFTGERVDTDKLKADILQKQQEMAERVEAAKDKPVPPAEPK